MYYWLNSTKSVSTILVIPDIFICGSLNKNVFFYAVKWDSRINNEWQSYSLRFTLRKDIGVRVLTYDRSNNETLRNSRLSYHKIWRKKKHWWLKLNRFFICLYHIYFFNFKISLTIFFLQYLFWFWWKYRKCFVYSV